MTQRVDYDLIASAYDQRYGRHEYRGVQRAVLAFAGGERPARVLEVGCGTGHWLAILAGRGTTVAGVDPSHCMLEHARGAAPSALLVRGRAEALPWQAASFDRVLCVNALHHFVDIAAFIAEAWRVLRPGGGLLIVGLDPHTGRDRWWIYEYFPSALETDRARYPSSDVVRRTMAAAGFVRCETGEVQHQPARVSVSAAIERGLLERSSTSQLMLLNDEEYREGVERIRAAGAAGATGAEEPTLGADLRLYGTTGWVPART